MKKRLVTILLTMTFLATGGFFFTSLTNLPVHHGSSSSSKFAAIRPSKKGSQPLVTQNQSKPPRVTKSSTKQTIQQSTAVLMYHYIRSGVDKKKDPVGYDLSVTPEEFEAQVAAFKNLGYRSLTMDQVASGEGGLDTVVFTFDDGYEDFYTSAFPILKKYGYSATVYVISGMIGGNYMTWDQIREVQSYGIEIGSHTVHHIDLAKADPRTVQREITDSKAEIEKQIGTSVASFCYPSGKYTQSVADMVRATGYASATTTQFGQVKRGDDIFTLRRVRVHPNTDLNQLVRESTISH